MLVLAPARTTRRIRASLAAASLVGAIASGPVQGQVASQPAARATARPDTVLSGQALQVATAIRAYFAASERGNLVAIDSLVAGERFNAVEGAGINRGWADYRDNHLGPELKEMTNFRYRPFEVEASTAGDIGWSTFRYAIRADLRGQAIDQVGRGTAILERSGNRWVIRHLQTSSRPRRPSDPPMPQ